MKSREATAHLVIALLFLLWRPLVHAVHTNLRASASSTSSSSDLDGSISLAVNSSSANLSGSRNEATTRDGKRNGSDASPASKNSQNSTIHQFSEPWVAPPPDGVPESFALVTTKYSLDAFTNNQPLIGCVGALVSTHHLLLDVMCLNEVLAPVIDAHIHQHASSDSTDGILLAFFNNKAIAIVVMEPVPSNKSLMVARLAELVDESFAKPLQLATNAPNTNDLLPDVQVVSFDEVLNRNTSQRRVTSSIWTPRHAVCTAQTSRANCFAFGQVQDRLQHVMARSNFVVTTRERFLGGIVRRTNHSISGLFAFVPINDALQAEINRITGDAAIWSFSQELQPTHPLPAISRYQFLTRLQFTTPRAWGDSCQAVLIAPTFVLTSFECFDQHNPVTSVVVGVGRKVGDLEEIPVKNQVAESAVLLLELQVACSFAPVILLEEFANDTSDAEPVLVHSSIEGATDLEVVTERLHFVANESAACNVPGSIGTNGEVRCVMNMHAFQGLDMATSIVPRRGDPLEYHLVGISVMFGFAAGETNDLSRFIAWTY